MIRKAFLMKLKPGCREEYQRRHTPIWPELQKVLKEHGVQNYSIFLEPDTNRLFAYAEIESEQLWRQIANTDVCRRWWAHLKELMETYSDNDPVKAELEEVFRLD
jgi:L-rhamnose mutarotase